jgi:hypothetical protein
VILIAAVCLAAVVVAFVVWPGEREPEYQGRKLSEWLEPYNDVGDDEARVAAIKHIGTNALPFLLSWMQYEPPPWRESIYRHLYKLPKIARKDLTYRVLLGKGELRLRAVVRGFEALGPEAAPAVPELARILSRTKSTGTGYRATFALASIGEEGLPALTNALADPHCANRYYAAEAIGSIGDKARAAVPALLLVLNDPDPVVRDAATLALRQVAPELEPEEDAAPP